MPGDEVRPGPVADGAEADHGRTAPGSHGDRGGGAVGSGQGPKAGPRAGTRSVAAAGPGRPVSGEPARRGASRWTVPTLAVGLVALAAVAVWAAAAGVGPARFDGLLLEESVEERSPPLTELAIVVTTVGSTVGSALLAIVAGAWCWARARRADAVLAVGAMAGASLVFRGLKMGLDRARPPVVDRAVTVTNESLPSGHATMSIVVTGTIVVLAWAGLGRRGRALLVGAAVLWVGAVGATRVYLGVHWLSDVLAGWAVGAAWLALCVLVWRRWRGRRLTHTG